MIIELIKVILGGLKIEVDDCFHHNNTGGQGHNTHIHP